MSNFAKIRDKILGVLSSYYLVLTCLFLLFLLTWFGTLEQVESGLYLTSKKYFSAETFFLIPRVNGAWVPLVLPSAYWVSIVLFFNLLIGGILRLKKTLSRLGILISHSGILFLLLSGFVSQHFSQRGNMPLEEGMVSSIAQHYTDCSIEIFEIKDQSIAEIRIIDAKYLKNLKPNDMALFELPDFPFSLEISHYSQNAFPVATERWQPTKGEEVVDGFYLHQGKREIQEEINQPACYARLITKDKNASSHKWILATASFQPKTVVVDGRTFVISMKKQIWAMPFKVKLENFTAEFYPGTNKPKRFESEIIRIDDEQKTPITIKMNQPMRHKGYTFYQASWGGENQKLFSVFEVVKNPADQWPKWSLYVVSFGLALHFCQHLIRFLIKGKTP